MLRLKKSAINHRMIEAFRLPVLRKHAFALSAARRSGVAITCASSTQARLGVEASRIGGLPDLAAGRRADGVRELRPVT
jgi:hypothetical protein